jgi:hypothetical protein
MLELSSDPCFHKVPALPGFPSVPCRFSTASAAYTSGTRPPLPVEAAGGASPAFTTTRNLSHFLPRPVSASPNIAEDWVERGIAAPSARCSMTSPIMSITLRRACRYWHTGFSDLYVFAGDRWPPRIFGGGRPLPRSHGHWEMSNTDREIDFQRNLLLLRLA